MLRLAVAQFKPAKGDYAQNVKRLGTLFGQVAAWPEPPDVVLLPEAALTGYLVEGGVREVAVTAGTLLDDLAAQHQLAGAPPLDVAVGFYERWRDRLYNSALYASLGGGRGGARILHVHRKVFLPTYGVFDEERFVEAGHQVGVFTTRWGKAAILICEDAWHSLTTAVVALRGAQLVIIPSASPARGVSPQDETLSRPGNVSKWERIARDAAEEHGVWVAVPQLVGFEGGKGFAGGSVVASPRGEIVVRGPLWDEALIDAPVDLGEIGRARADLPLLADLETHLPHLLASLERPAGRGPAFDPGDGAPTAAAPIHGAPPFAVAAPATRDPLALDCALAVRWLEEFLREEVRGRRAFERVVLGLSGGVDSAVAAFLAARALGKENVCGFMLPYRTSSPESVAHAQLVVDALGIEARTIDISPAVDGYLSAAEPDADALRRGNVMARVRMIVLFDQGTKLKALPLGTGNKTERLFGYYTWHADDSPPINPLGDLFKTQVWELARHLGVPRAIVEKPATADLARGQTDEGDLGISYLKADRILFALLRGMRPAGIVRAGYTEAEVELVARRLASTHWKRRLPTVAMVSPTAIGESYLRPVDY